MGKRKKIANTNSVTARKKKMAMVVSHSNREIIKLVLTSPRDYHTKLLWVGDLATDSFCLARSGITQAGKICDQDKFTKEKINLHIY